MSDKTKIEWADATWNPVTGCIEVSPGCDHCYAKTFAERWRGAPGHYFEQGFDVQLRWNKLEEPLKWTRPRRVFVNSMSDLFHEEIPDAYIAEVFAVMAKAPQHVFQLLTKRHGRMRSLLNRPSFRDCVMDASPAGVWPLPNLWVGVSVENQQWADIRADALRQTPAAVRWLSMEPLLGPVFLAEEWLTWLNWVVVGGESGPGARPMHPDWARSLRDQCGGAGVPFFFKQWGESLPLIGHREFLELGPAKDGNRDWSRPFGDDVTMCRVGKGNAGRLLDGRTWDEYPVGA